MRAGFSRYRLTIFWEMRCEIAFYVTNFSISKVARLIFIKIKIFPNFSILFQPRISVAQPRKLKKNNFSKFFYVENWLRWSFFIEVVQTENAIIFWLNLTTIRSQYAFIFLSQFLILDIKYIILGDNRKFKKRSKKSLQAVQVFRGESTF